METTNKLANAVPAALAHHQAERAEEWTTDARRIKVAGFSEEARRRHDKNRLERKRRFENTLDAEVTLPQLQGVSSEEDAKPVSTSDWRYAQTQRPIPTPAGRYQEALNACVRGDKADGLNSLSVTQREWKPPRFVSARKVMERGDAAESATRKGASKKLVVRQKKDKYSEQLSPYTIRRLFEEDF